MLNMSCTNGSDGYPSQAEFNRRMEHYIIRKKRAERTVVSEPELAVIYHLLSDSAAMRAEPDVSHRTWVKKTFVLRSFVNGTFVCHKDKGQTAPHPVASKEKMYFILKQAHASEGHGGRDKTAKAVKKTHSFIRKGLICLFLEVCPTCRARNDAVKKDKLANAQSASEAASPLWMDSTPSLELWDHSQSQYLQPGPNPYQSNPHQSTPGLYHPRESSQTLAIPTLSTALRRAPSHGEVSTFYPDPTPVHARSHTYPLLDNNYNPQQSLAEASPSVLTFLSPTTAYGAPEGRTFDSLSYNTDNLPDLASLDHQSFCPTIFAVQVDAPGQLGASAHEYFQNNQQYFDNQRSQGSEHQPSLATSSNLYDPININYLPNIQVESNLQLSSTGAQFNTLSTAGAAFTHERMISSNSSAPDHPAYESFQELSRPSSAHDLSNSYDATSPSPYKPTNWVNTESFNSVQVQGGSRRSFQDKNHKHLSLQSLEGSQNLQTNFYPLETGNSSGPSTAESLWTTGSDLSTPTLGGDFQNLVLNVSSVGPSSNEE